MKWVVISVGVAIVLVLGTKLMVASKVTSPAKEKRVSHLDSLDPNQVNWLEKDDAYWKGVLTDDQFNVCRKNGTERAFSGEYHSYKKPGTFVCSSCGLPLFKADNKFDSGTGWPSYWQPESEKAVELHQDTSFGMVRTEVKCSRCKAHLGHVFDDGPQPTGKRYCINSVCLLHRPK